MPRRPTMSVVAALAAVALLLTGCGDDDESGGGDRPSVDELAERLASTDQITEDQAECVARAFVDSDISDDGLSSLLESGGVAGLDESDLSDDDRAAVEEATQAVIACATEGVEEDLATTTTAGG